MKSTNYSNHIKDYLGQQFDLPEEQIEAMLPEFKKTLSSHMAVLERVYTQDNLHDLERAAHTIKGAFLNLGLNECAELAMKIESSAVSGDNSCDYSVLISAMGSIVREITAEQS